MPDHKAKSEIEKATKLPRELLNIVISYYGVGLDALTPKLKSLDRVLEKVTKEELRLYFAIDKYQEYHQGPTVFHRHEIKLAEAARKNDEFKQWIRLHKDYQKIGKEIKTLSKGIKALIDVYNQGNADAKIILIDVNERMNHYLATTPNRTFSVASMFSFLWHSEVINSHSVVTEMQEMVAQMRQELHSLPTKKI